MAEGGSGPGLASQARPRPAAGRPRQAHVDRAILEAALRLVRRRGPRGVTVEAVAAESGVAKTTIYRRYRDRSELLRAAMAQVVELPAPAAESPLREQLITFLEQFRTGMEHSVGLRAVAALLSPEDDREFAQAARATALAPRLRQGLDLFAAAVARGELRPDVDYQRVVELLIGSYLARAALSGQESIDSEWPAVVIDLVLRAVRPAAD
jgi:AcrR family transcriptional regulator